MTTRRERKEARLQKRLEWAEGRDQRSDAAFQRAHGIMDMIPLGQPILVGHHSERHARRDQTRIDNAMRDGVDSGRMAEHHREVATNIERQLDHSIFSDDEDAPERMRERIAELEAQRERMKAVNAEIKRGAGWEARLRDAGAPLTEHEKADLITVARFQEYDRFPPYALSNLGANIRRLKGRLKIIEETAAGND